MPPPYINYILARNADKHARMMHRRHIRDACNPFELPDPEFVHLYRVSKEMVHYICAQIGPQMQAMRTDGLPVHIKVLASIKFMADGHYQRGTGQDHGLCIGQTTVSRYLAQFCPALLTLMNTWIKFPGDAQSRLRVSQGFCEKYGVPNLLGTIDCTHVEIFPPPLPHGATFINRKGVHTINVQLVADVDSKILGVLARFSGNTHDQFIFNNSNIKEEMKRLHDERIGEYFLLGDSGYALEPWLMTPILEAAPNTPEERYTQWHCRVRNIIERTNGYLKGSFRCLGGDRVLHYAPNKACEIIYACCILYNMRKRFRVEIAEENWVADEEEEGPPANLQPGLLLRIAQERRAALIRNYFN